MINNIKVEICVGNVDDAIIASKYPIDRIELNSSLELGGITPSLEVLKYLKTHINTPICCMDRPRGGDFEYSNLEYQIMLNDAKLMLENGADGVVFGFLKDNHIDIDRTRTMVELIHSYGKEAIFHKAFDELEDIDGGCKELIDLKVDRILTSGKAVYPDILEGCKRINELVNKYKGQIQLLPGGGVRTHNIIDVIKTSNAMQIHMTSKKNNEGGYVQLDVKQLEDLLSLIQLVECDNN
ncbi:MAG: copper homeostasis protein CutC [Erysipelotrichaceae bacterium]|nr:copper homeostasis protein CutC [Erysipelotrichaceae bacterium]